MSPTLKRLAAVTAAASLAAVSWGVLVERHLFTVRRARLAVLPAGARPLRVLHLSDIHMAPWQRRKQAWIGALTEWEPDLIVNTGDNLGHAEGILGIRAAFDAFRGIPGLYVHGSNDLHGPAPRNPFRYFSGPSRRTPTSTALDTAALERFFEDELGWRGLNNASASFEVGGLRVDALGTHDAHLGLDRLDVLPGLAEGFPSGDDAVRLAVTHAPYRRVLDAFSETGPDVILAGHTHGGQVRVPGLGALVANCDIPLRQSRGLSSWPSADGPVPLNVSAGLGHSIYAPVRFACLPEASMLELVARDEADVSARAVPIG